MSRSAYLLEPEAVVTDPDPDAVRQPWPDAPDETGDERVREPRRGHLSLLDLAVGAGSLATRAGLLPARVGLTLGRQLAAAHRADRAGVEAEGGGARANPVLDWSGWAVRSVAQVGAFDRDRARGVGHAVKSRLASRIAADPDVGRMAREIAGGQLDSLIDQAVPRVLARLAEDPEAVQRIVQEQSVGLVSEAVDSARDSARRGDEAADSAVSRLLHRRPVAGGGSADPGGPPS